ncbi:MAG: hypothetical protein AB7J28_11775 [Hyphomonadaceae bacterium]
MRASLIVLLLLAGCGQREAPAGTQEAAPRAQLWFLCDDLAGGPIFAAVREGSEVALTRYARDGAAPQTDRFVLGEPEGAVGSVFTPLLRAGAEAGSVRAINPGMLDDPNAAYTPPVTSLRLDGVDHQCRWLERTRAFAITDRRSVLVAEDGDGDLIYQTFDFARAGEAPQVDLGAARSTIFSLEIRGGEETDDATGQTFAFENAGYRYTLAIPANDPAALIVTQAGRQIQHEEIRALITGPREAPD